MLLAQNQKHSPLVIFIGNRFKITIILEFVWIINAVQDSTLDIGIHLIVRLDDFLMTVENSWIAASVVEDLRLKNFDSIFYTFS